MDIVTSPAMKREVKSFGEQIANPIKKYITFLGKEPVGGLAHVNNHLKGQSYKMLEAGKLDLLSSLQETREVQLNLHPHHNIIPSRSSTIREATSLFLSADQALDSTIAAAETALELAAKSAETRKARRQSLQPTLDNILIEGERKDDDFTQWYGKLFDSSA
jgi:hypothetical protein